ncbi:MAG: hypothetical protein PWQ68_1589, partial [Thermoanaerobacteraceae bacterium]|nr:hypothetical protein [Thermoanaerobacteraceae bacterium]
MNINASGAANVKQYAALMPSKILKYTPLFAKAAGYATIFAPRKPLTWLTLFRATGLS